RARAAEIALLARAFLAQAAPVYGRTSVPVLSPEAIAALERHAWPGNLRELRNVVERAIVLCDGATILPEHLPPSSGGGPGEEEPPSAQERQRRRILDALALCAGNQSRAAKMLGISRRTLVTRLDELRIARPRKGR